MRCSFGYTVKSPYVERRVKYYDENGIYDESVQSDDELIVIGEKLRNGASLMYTWNIGLGSDFVSVFAYYLASPLNWLVVLFPKSC